jgi:photosystem II stability/assembly factor-like uncharacterized protein
LTLGREIPDWTATMKHKPFLNRVICIFTVFLAGALAPPLHAAVDPDLLAGLKARAIGPAAMSGRITAIDAVASDPNRIVIGVATGGVWLSDNGGLTWDPVFDDQGVASIGAVAINQKYPNIIWVGTGEGNTRNSTSIGDGIYKSIDGGRTWQNMGLGGSERINRIALHPDNPDIAYVAALGALWSSNTERGVYRSTNGGRSWDRILYVDDTTGATDIKMDPSNPDKLFAGMWQFRRWPYHFKSGGPGSGLYVSHDGGDSWQQRTEEDGLPAGELGRIAISIAPADPGRVYALVEAGKSALLRSDDGGVSWAKVNEEHNVADRPFYYTEVIADPQNPDRVYNMATRLRVSIDGGRNFEYNSVIDCCTPGNTIHIDNHAFWINPADPRHLIVGNDGGIAISRDRGETWRFVRNLPLAQYYHVAVDNEHPYHVYGGLQDNGSWRGPAEIWEPAGIRNLHWQEVGFGDGFDTIPDPENARAGYAMSQGGHLQRYDLDRGQQKLIRPAPPEPDIELRFNWNAGFEQDPFDAATIYYGSQFLHKSTDRGLSWTVISGDLTSNNPDWQTFHSSGGLTPDVTAAENFTTIVAVAASRLEPGLIWVGTDDGRVHVTRDGGEDWARIDESARGVPAGAWVPMIAPSPHEPGTAFVVFDDHRRGDMSPYVYRADEFGRRWTRLSPDGLAGYALSVLQDTVNPRLLFVGTELGLYFSLDGGQSWTRFSAGVPTVSVMDMAIQERESDLVLGTHGRSVLVIDDYGALRGLTENDFGVRLKLLSATPGQLYDADPTSSTRFTGSSEYRGPNEPYGVMVTFMASGGDLPHPQAERERERKIARRAAGQMDTGQDESKNGKNKPPRVKVRVSNAAGEVIRSFEHEVHQGINRLTWGMQIDGVRQPPGTEEKDRKEFPTGAEVVPGRYRIELELDGVTTAIDAEVIADPRHPLSEAEHAARFAALRALQELEEAHVSALERIDRTRNDVQTIKALIEARQGAEPEPGLEDLLAQADEVADGLDSLEQRFRTPPRTKGIVYDDDKVAYRLAMAQSYVQSARHAPGPTAQAFVERARTTLAQALNSLNGFLAEDVQVLRAALAEAGIALLSEAEPLGLPE